MIKKLSVQEWMPFEFVLNNGIVKLKNNNYVKIIKIIPINYELKSKLEKEAILNSYKIFLKTCDFNIQILIQSKKENLSLHFSKLNEEKEKNKKLFQKNIYDNYINYLKEINSKNKSSSKNFFIIINNFNSNLIYESKDKNNFPKIESSIIEELNEKYYKIKECLSRCGNICKEISRDETIQLLYSFFNYRKNCIK